jgi:hypothetical protein
MPPPPMTPRTPGGGVFGAGIGLLKPKAHSTPNRQPDPAASLPAVTVQTTAVESSASSV